MTVPTEHHSHSFRWQQYTALAIALLFTSSALGGDFPTVEVVQIQPGKTASACGTDNLYGVDLDINLLGSEPSNTAPAASPVEALSGASQPPSLPDYLTQE